MVLSFRWWLLGLPFESPMDASCRAGRGVLHPFLPIFFVSIQAYHLQFSAAYTYARFLRSATEFSCHALAPVICCTMFCFAFLIWIWNNWILIGHWSRTLHPNWTRRVAQPTDGWWIHLDGWWNCPATHPIAETPTKSIWRVPLVACGFSLEY